jgi:hypothetical protein
MQLNIDALKQAAAGPGTGLPEAEILTYPGGHLTTNEPPDFLAAAIRDIAARHGVGAPATAHR